MLSILNALRFIFITMIFIFHMGVFPPGYCGVTFFFVLSGFVLTYGYGKKVTGTSFLYGTFLKKRLIKVYPTHLICLAFFIIMTIFTGDKSGDKVGTILIPNVFLIQSWVPRLSFYSSGNGVSWFLSDLVFFYAIFPFLYKGISSHLNKFTKISVVILVLYFCLIQVIPDKYHHAFFYIHPIFRLIDFVFGILVGCLFFKRQEKASEVRFKKTKFLLSILFFLLAIYIHSQIEDYAVSGYNVYAFASLYWLPSCFVIYYGALLGTVNIGCLNWFSKYSFDFYMIHQLIIKYTYLFLSQYNMQISKTTAIIFIFTLSYTLAYLTNKFIHRFITPKLTALPPKA